MDEILPLWELWLVASVLGVIMVMIVAAILVQHVGVPLVVAGRQPRGDTTSRMWGTWWSAWNP